MTWLISRALMEDYANSRSSLGLVEEYSAGTCSAGELCAPSNGSPTPQAFLPSAKMTAFSRPSRFGMTFAPLTDALGEELLMSYLAGFHAKTLASPGKAHGPHHWRSSTAIRVRGKQPSFAY